MASTQEQARATTGTWNLPLEPDYAGISDMVVLEVQTDGCTYHKWLSASVSDCAAYATWHYCSTYLFLCHAFASIMQDSHWKMNLFSATSQLVLVQTQIIFMLSLRIVGRF